MGAGRGGDERGGFSAAAHSHEKLQTSLSLSLSLLACARACVYACAREPKQTSVSAEHY